MFELGKTQSLIIVKELDFGVYLGEQPNASMDDRVLLPKKQVPQGSRMGDTVEVLVLYSGVSSPSAPAKASKLSSSAATSCAKSVSPNISLWFPLPPLR